MKSVREICALLALLLVVGCAPSVRTPFAENEQAGATVAGIPGARVWADDTLAIDRFRADHARLIESSQRRNLAVLSLSGGGVDGAFGAGLLAGWSDHGSRPVFWIVTGVSVGGLLAPFAFLGSRYDQALKRFFEEGGAERTPELREISVYLGPPLSRRHPLERPIAQYVDHAMLEAVAAEHRKGRRLFLVTTNVDAQRTAIWDMGAIAASNHPSAIELFRKVLMASASVPGVFPPVLIDVEAGGRHFREMHVDGGVSTNLLIAPDAFFFSSLALKRDTVRPRLFVVINNKLVPEFEVVRDDLLVLARRSISTMIKANVRGSVIASYEFARRMRWEFNLAAIEADFPSSASTDFDPAYLQRLYRYGYMKGRSGTAWRSNPDQLRSPQRTMAFPLRPEQSAGLAP